MHVRYKGQKSMHVDTLFGTGKIWHGHGDVQEVTDEKVAEKMTYLQPSVYEEAKPERPAAADVGPLGKETSILDSILVKQGKKEVTLRQATRATAFKYARDELGLQIPKSATKETILTLAANALEMREDTTSPEGSGDDGSVHPTPEEEIPDDIRDLDIDGGDDDDAGDDSGLDGEPDPEDVI